MGTCWSSLLQVLLSVSEVACPPTALALVDAVDLKMIYLVLKRPVFNTFKGFLAEWTDRIWFFFVVGDTGMAEDATTALHFGWHARYVKTDRAFIVIFFVKTLFHELVVIPCRLISLLATSTACIMNFSLQLGCFDNMLDLRTCFCFFCLIMVMLTVITIWWSCHPFFKLQGLGWLLWNSDVASALLVFFCLLILFVGGVSYFTFSSYN